AVENGNYSAYLTDGTPLSGGTLTDPTSPGTGDITLGQLAQRSVKALRTFFPKVRTTGAPTGQWYDFNGNGVPDPPYILHGHECLAFFLGGVPLPDALPPGTPTSFGLTGFAKDPANPFKNSIVGNAMYDANRQPPFFEFNPGRLFLDPNSLTGIPGYYDSLNNSPPGSGVTHNFYAYFNAYGSGAYDPNDVNIPEQDNNNSGPIGLQYLVGFPTVPQNQTLYVSISPSPNPYTSTTTAPTSGTITYQNPQSFQIISSGLDGQYGVGGQYLQA